MASGPITSRQIDQETVETVAVPKSLQMVIAAMKLRHLLLGRKVMNNLDSILKNRHYCANKGPSSQSYGFCSSHVWMWEFNCEESWAPKNWCFWTVVLEKTLESPLDSKIQPVHPKGNQSWIFIGRIDALADFGHLIQRTDSLEKTLMLGKIEGGRRRGWQRMRRLDGITDSIDMRLSKSRNWWTGKPGMLKSMRSQSQAQLSDWTELK